MPLTAKEQKAKYLLLREIKQSVDFFEWIKNIYKENYIQ